MSTIIIERAFVGTSKLEDAVTTLLVNRIDDLVANRYDFKRANAIPSQTEGAAK